MCATLDSAGKMTAMVVLLQLLAVVAEGAGVSRHMLKRQSGEPWALYPAQNFTMPVDHFHNESRYAPHTNATFQQQYWLDTSNYVEGGPVIIHAMGEDSEVSDYIWLQKGILHDVAKATGGVAVLWGQRYYAGAYDIVPELTTESLRFHSTEQAMADLAYFARRATFTGLEDKNLTAPGTPWIILGGSYGGVISAFTRIQYPDLFWGGLSSSGITTAFEDMWQYYDVIRRYGPPECVQTQQQLVALMDNVFDSGNKTALDQLVSAFNVSTASTWTDLQGYLAGTLSTWDQNWNYPPAPFSGPGSYCANITSPDLLYHPSASLQETARDLLVYANKTATPKSSTLFNPLVNYFSYILNNYNFCPGKTISDCLGLNSPSAFNWIVCTEYGQFAGGYVPGSPDRPAALPLASRAITVQSALDQCQKVYNITYGPQLQRFNKYGGANLSYPRLALSTGELDYYRPATPLAETLPNGDPNPRIQSNGTAGEPQTVIKGGYHEWDFPGLAPNETDYIQPAAAESAQQREIEAVKLWLQEWNQTHGAA